MLSRLLLLVLLVAPILVVGSDSCAALWDTHVEKLTAHPPKPYKESGKVIFNHIARTAGSNFLSCFLRHITEPNRRCPNLYVTPSEFYKLIRSMPSECDLVSSHLDASVMSYLPTDDYAMLTQLRDPVSRAISMYEYAIESGSRMYAWSNADPNTAKPEAKGPLASSVWPWNYLLPFFEHDISLRMPKVVEQEWGDLTNIWVKTSGPEGKDFFYNKALNISKWDLSEDDIVLPDIDPYDNPMVMPLAEWVKTPIAHEIVHNGQSFAVLGISNISMWEAESKTLRECVRSDFPTFNSMMDLSRKLLRQYMHVGVNDQLELSVETATWHGSVALD
eukprot:gene1356-32718_t